MKFFLLSLFILLPGSSGFANDLFVGAGAIDEVPAEAVKLINKENYEASRLEILGTKFFILTRKKNGLTQTQISKAIYRAWPIWRRKFVFDFSTITFIDYNQLLGGGPMGPPATLGIYLGEQVPIQASEVIESMLGWKAQQTAKAYVSQNYVGFADPLQAYVDDMVTHELGHLIFGYGRTIAPESLDRWFALGLGLIYDRMVWHELHSTGSPLFDATVKIWKNKYSTIPEIDQRLVNPVTLNDSTFGLVRDQNYCHGKAWVYLSELRDRLGHSRFDAIVQDYIFGRPMGSLIEYDDFLTYLSQSEKLLVRKIEEQYLIR